MRDAMLYKNLHKTLFESTGAPAAQSWYDFTRAFNINEDMVEFLEDYMGMTIYSLDTFYMNYETPEELLNTYPDKFLKAIHLYMDSIGDEMSYKEIIKKLGEIL